MITYLGKRLVGLDTGLLYFSTLVLGIAIQAFSSSPPFVFALEFRVGATGNVSYAGGSAPLVGTSIGITNAFVGLPFTSPFLQFIDAGANFTTGAADHSDSFPPFNEGRVSFSNGGSITLSTGPGGALRSPFTPPLVPILSNTVLFNGTFTGGPDVFDHPVNPQLIFSRTNFVFFGGTVEGTISPALAQSLGLPSNVPYTGFLEGTINSLDFSVGPVNGPLQSGISFLRLNPVPESTSWVLLGTGIAGLLTWMRYMSSDR